MSMEMSEQARKRSDTLQGEVLIVNMKRLIVLFLVFLLAGCGASKPNPSDQLSAKIPNIPHEVSQNMNCLTCHKTGANGAKVTPHSDRPNCISCHQSSN